MTAHELYKLRRVPGVLAVDQTHPRSGSRIRRYPVYAPLCRDCQHTAQGR